MGRQKKSEKYFREKQPGEYNMKNFKIVKPKGLHRGNINLEFDIESEYKSRLKLIDSNNISKRIGFVPLWMIKDMYGEPAKDGKVTILLHINDNKIILQNDKTASAVELMIKFHSILNKHIHLSESDLIRTVTNPIRRGIHKIEASDGEIRICLLVKFQQPDEPYILIL